MQKCSMKEYRPWHATTLVLSHSGSNFCSSSSNGSSTYRAVFFFTCCLRLYGNHSASGMLGLEWFLDVFGILWNNIMRSHSNVCNLCLNLRYLRVSSLWNLKQLIEINTTCTVSFEFRIGRDRAKTLTLWTRSRCALTGSSGRPRSISRIRTSGSTGDVNLNLTKSKNPEHWVSTSWGTRFERLRQ